MFGWFSAFREHGAPTFYGDNRTPVTLDTHIVALCSLFVVPSIAYLIVLPGIRKLRTASTLSFLFTMAVGATLLVSLYHPCWHRAEARIFAPYRAFSTDKMDAIIMVRVGLQYMNISLTANMAGTDANGDPLEPLKYNERFAFTEVNRMEKELNNALRKGLPFPILKVIEYLSAEGFEWGRQYRLAGYYTAALLWTAFSCWVVSLVCLAMLPHMFARCTLCTGICIGLSDIVFFSQIPRGMSIRFASVDGWTMLHFRPSICFHATCLAALACMVAGSCLWWLDSKNIYHFDTIFSARRYAQDSVVDEYKETTTLTEVFAFDSLPSTRFNSMELRRSR